MGVLRGGSTVGNVRDLAEQTTHAIIKNANELIDGEYPSMLSAIISKKDVEEIVANAGSMWSAYSEIMNRVERSVVSKFSGNTNETRNFWQYIRSQF